MHVTATQVLNPIGFITEHPARTLAAYLGDREAELALHADSIPFPTSDDFRSDSVFDPNPHRLDLSSGYVETALLVHSLAVWGPDALIRAAFACAKLQVEGQTACRPDLVGPRDAALQAVAAYLQTPTNERLQQVAAAVGWCNELYAPHEEDPDTEDARTAWTQLGAPWFAAETAAQDFKLESYDGDGPREASSTWCQRNIVLLKNPFHGLYHRFKNSLGDGAISQFNSYLKLFFGSLYQLND